MKRSGKIQTVLGLVDPSDIGITMTHEHLSMDFTITYQPSSNVKYDNCEFEMDKLGWIRQNPYSHKLNLTLLDSEQLMREELRKYKSKGGSCLVENSTIGLNRDIKSVQRVAQDTGVHVVAGTGYYVSRARPETHKLTVEEMTNQMIQDIEVGAEGTDIKCGVIGEVGCQSPITETERRSLQAAAAAQTQLGCGVIVHPGRESKEPFEIVRILQEAGGDVKKTVMSHLDRTIADYDQLVEFAGQGMYCEYDLFGIDVSHYQLAPAVDMPNDAERIKRIKTLVDAGYGDKVLIAHDIHTKERLEKYGGHGFSHILDNVVPKMLARGLSQSSIDKILIHNPRTWMTFK